ncbi:MAG: hypothetical protein IJS59_02100 [Bacteroidaceae bacterium]|nr:hypothetical protein [Bacteroidaceae bacterium]
MKRTYITPTISTLTIEITSPFLASSQTSSVGVSSQQYGDDMTDLAKKDSWHDIWEDDWSRE